MKRAWVVAALALGVALPLAAQPQVPDGKWWKRPRIAAEIGLTSDQSDQIEKIFVKSRPRLIDLKADLERKQFDLQVAMDDRNSDRRDIEKKLETVEDARKELQKARVLMILDIKQVLKPEQWERLLQMQQEARRRLRERRQSRLARPAPDDLDAAAAPR
ncbi:MAG: Spy/CpxP family protein refolding chaperone [Acidobacteriota bacterium]